jgi:hypothetical protein
MNDSNNGDDGLFCLICHSREIVEQVFKLLPGKTYNVVFYLCASHTNKNYWPVTRRKVEQILKERND